MRTLGRFPTASHPRPSAALAAGARHRVLFMRPSLRWPLQLVMLLALLAGCGGDRTAASGHLDQLEQLGVFNDVPPFASAIGSGRRDRCHEPDFERQEPATWRDFAFEGPPEAVLRHYTDELLTDRWAEADATDYPDFPSVRFEKDFGDWTGAILVTVITEDSSYGLTAQDATSQVCPS